jgi:SPP1 family predicted phage head-tail adaptor
MTSRIGELRHRIVLEAPVRTADGGGGATVSWMLVAETWAAIRPVGGSESVVAEQIAGRVSHVIELRHRSGVEPRMRIRREARTFEILAVLDVDERRRRLRCLCREELL